MIFSAFLQTVLWLLRHLPLIVGMLLVSHFLLYKFCNNSPRLYVSEPSLNIFCSSIPKTGISCIMGNSVTSIVKETEGKNAQNVKKVGIGGQNTFGMGKVSSIKVPKRPSHIPLFFPRSLSILNLCESSNDKFQLLPRDHQAICQDVSSSSRCPLVMKSLGVKHTHY